MKSLFTILIIFALCTCIDPYSPKLTGYESLLVIDGLITDADESYKVKLSRTFQEQNSTPEIVTDATVFITDDSGNEVSLSNTGRGIYKTDSTQFRGIIGKTYRLHILTKDGQQYESSPCMMQPVPDIERIYVEVSHQLINNGTVLQKGAQVYLDSKAGDNNSYLRWSFDETWKFKVANPQKFEYINDSTIPPVREIKDYCWKNNKSNDILISSTNAGQSALVKKEPIFFIAPELSDRLLIQYSILVNQYSVSKEEFDFWNNMKSINENSGDIFAKQPFSVISNIHNISNPGERVLGYFQVSAVKQKRMNLPFSEILKLNLPFYHYPCERLERRPADYQGEWGPVITWDDVYRFNCLNSSYTLVEPGYAGSVLEKLVFTKPECANCELTGTRTKPDFWIDLK